MGEIKRGKFSLGDIIQKLNQTEKVDEKKDAGGNPVSAATAGQFGGKEQQTPNFSESPHISPTTPASPGGSTGSLSFSPASRDTETIQASRNHASPGTTPSVNDTTRFEATPTSPLSPGQDLASQDEHIDFDIQRYIGILLRRKSIVIITLLIASIFSIYSYMNSVRLYTAHARLLFSPGYQDIMGSNQNTFFSWGSREGKINTHIELLKSTTVLKNVAEKFEGNPSVEALAAGIKISRGTIEGEKNDIIEIAFRHTNAVRAHDIINEVCRTYIEYIKVYRT
jgi:hypothetical protein